MPIEKLLNSAKKFGINAILIGSLYFNPIINNSYAENFSNTTKKLDTEEKILWTSYVLLNVIDAY